MRSLIACLLAVILGACSSGNSGGNRQDYFYHTVSRDGETLSAISRWYTGASSNWPHLARHNPGLNP